MCNDVHGSAQGFTKVLNANRPCEGGITGGARLDLQRSSARRLL